MTRLLERRLFLAGLAATACPLPARAESGTARRVFSIWRDGSDIGRHVLEARSGPDGFEIDIDVDIAVKLLGFTAYRYTLTNREVWRDRRIVSVDSRCDDDGDAFEVSIRQGTSALEVDGTEYSGSEPLSSVTTSYFAPAFLDRGPWISTQSGRPLDISVRQQSGTRWSVTGDLNTVLTYEEGEWVGSRFEVEGSRITYQTLESEGAIAPLWRQA